MIQIPITNKEPDGNLSFNFNVVKPFTTSHTERKYVFVLGKTKRTLRTCGCDLKAGEPSYVEATF